MSSRELKEPPTPKAQSTSLAASLFQSHRIHLITLLALSYILVLLTFALRSFQDKPSPDTASTPPAFESSNPSDGGSAGEGHFANSSARFAKKWRERIDRLYAMGHIPWLEYLDQLDDDNLAPLTKEVQRWIYEKQHPPVEECAKARYYVEFGTDVGLGAKIHQIGFNLAVALEAGRIFIYHPDAGTEFADHYCGQSQPRSHFECHWQPISSCSYSYSNSGNSVYGAEWSRLELDGVARNYPDCPSLWIKRLTEHFPGHTLTANYFKYWWRAQSAAYISRLNAETSDVVRKLRMDPNLHHEWVSGRTDPIPAPYPLPSGTMNMHVRHGDKYLEMTLIPFDDYINSALKYSAENPLSALKRLFVSSEDPDVITRATRLPNEPPFQGTSPDSAWHVYTSSIPRFNDGPRRQMEMFGRSKMVRHWYLQLLMNLECDSFWGTRKSNWNRLIDELRCVWVDKCKVPYFEVGLKTDWVDYHW